MSEWIQLKSYEKGQKDTLKEVEKIIDEQIKQLKFLMEQLQSKIAKDDMYARVLALIELKQKLEELK